MSLLWVRDADKIWTASTLMAGRHDLHLLFAARSPGDSARSVERRPAVQLNSFSNGNTEAWAIMAGPRDEVRINGVALSAVGMRVLADRDEIGCASLGSVFFSTESLAAVVAFAGFERAVYCGRCRQAIKQGAQAVRCPGCGVWYDQSDEFPCFTYSSHCTFCSQSTALDAGYSWVPED